MIAIAVMMMIGQGTPSGGPIPEIAYEAIQHAASPSMEEPGIAADRFIRSVRALVSYSEDWRAALVGRPNNQVCFWLRAGMVALSARKAWEIQRVGSFSADGERKLADVTKEHADKCGPGSPGAGGSALWDAGGGEKWLAYHATKASRLHQLADMFQPVALGAALAGIQVSQVLAGRPVLCRSCKPAEPVPALIGAAILAGIVFAPGAAAVAGEGAGAELLRILATTPATP